MNDTLKRCMEQMKARRERMMDEVLIIDSADEKKIVSKVKCSECGSSNVEPFFHVLLGPAPFESHEEFSESTKRFMSCQDCGHID